MSKAGNGFGMSKAGNGFGMSKAGNGFGMSKAGKEFGMSKAGKEFGDDSFQQISSVHVQKEEKSKDNGSEIKDIVEAVSEIKNLLKNTSQEANKIAAIRQELKEVLGNNKKEDLNEEINNKISYLLGKLNKIDNNNVTILEKIKSLEELKNGNISLEDQEELLTSLEENNANVCQLAQQLKNYQMEFATIANGIKQCDSNVQKLIESIDKDYFKKTLNVLGEITLLLKGFSDMNTIIKHVEEVAISVDKKIGVAKKEIISTVKNSPRSDIKKFDSIDNVIPIAVILLTIFVSLLCVVDCARCGWNGATIVLLIFVIFDILASIWYLIDWYWGENIDKFIFIGLAPEEKWIGYLLFCINAVLMIYGLIVAGI